MEKTFGAFIRQKRKTRGIKLNAFAKAIGISSVYASYIENGVRPAPSEKVLSRIPSVLNMNDSEIALMYSLAAFTHPKIKLPDDVLQYIGTRESVVDALRVAKSLDVPDSEWIEIKRRLLTFYQ